MNLVSIIVPCYNYGHLLPYTLDSILSQSYQNWEAVIIDDGSEDHTREVALSYQQRDSRFRYVYQTNSGLSSARNTGIKNALGEFIIFLDADDLISEDKVEAHIAHLSQSEYVDISYSSALYFAHDRPDQLFKRSSLSQRPWMPQLSGSGIKVLKELIKRNMMPVSSPCIRKKSIEVVGEFNTNLKSMEDWDYWIRCALAGFKFSYLADSACYTLIRVQKKSLSKNTARMADYEIQIRESLRKTISHFNAAMVSPEEMSVLNNLNCIYVYRALMRSGQVAGYSGIFAAHIKLRTFQRIRMFVVDSLRFFKSKLKAS